MATTDTTPRYTMDEARYRLAVEECATRDHDYAIVSNMAGDPVTIHCARCGRSWKVQPAESSAARS